MKKTTLLFHTLLISLFTLNAINAQSSCANALTVTAGTTTAGAITGTINNTCYTSSTATYGSWYSYTANFDGTLTISSNLSQNDGTTYSDDTRLSIFSGTCSTLTCVSYSDDISTTNYLSSATILVSNGESYFIYWDDNWNANGFQFEITENTASCPTGTLPVSEDFNSTANIYTCWSQIDNDGDGNGWFPVDYDLDNDGVADGNPCVASASYDNTDGPLTPDNWLISFPIDLTSSAATDNIALQWKARGVDSNYADENYTVYVATGNTISDFTSSSVTFNEIVGQNGGAGVYASRSLDISSLAGQTIYVAFRHHNVSDEFVLNIDDVSITSTLGIENVALSKFKHHYDASSNQLTLKSSENNFTAISVYTISGQQVFSKNLSNTKEVVDLPNLAKGLYMAKVSIGNTVQNIKFTK
ncbi:T9SS-dependent choice-of-anchor J family protein [Neptunitalea chrysea]|nr:choice-of-anchor J domain-containing protein [Neptunitalea chrysea]